MMPWPWTFTRNQQLARTTPGAEEEWGTGHSEPWSIRCREHGTLRARWPSHTTPRIGVRREALSVGIAIGLHWPPGANKERRPGCPAAASPGVAHKIDMSNPFLNAPSDGFLPSPFLAFLLCFPACASGIHSGRLGFTTTYSIDPCCRVKSLIRLALAS